MTLFKFAAGLSLAATIAFGQDIAFFGPQEEGIARMKMQLEGAVMGGTVKGAPYSGEEVTSDTQVLADGTRIHHENRTTVYRDSEGRVRRETPDQVTIMDPVAGASYFLNPKSQTGRKMPMMNNVRVFHSIDDKSGVARTESSFSMTTSRNGDMTATINGNPVDPKVLAEAMARAKADGGPVTLPGELGQHIVVERQVTGDKVMLDKMDAEKMAAEKTIGLSYVVKDRGKSEDLGKSTIEGVAATGTRNTMTIDTGVIGNDRPIQRVTERWYSPDLQTVISSKTTDPRTGETTFQLTNIRRDEPAAYLFQVPAGYTINDRR